MVEMIVESFLVWLAHCLIRCLINLQLNKTLVLLDFLSFQFLPFKKWFCTGNWTMAWHAEAMTVSYPGPQTSSTLRWPFIQLLDLLRQHHHLFVIWPQAVTPGSWTSESDNTITLCASGRGSGWKNISKSSKAKNGLWSFTLPDVT